MPDGLSSILADMAKQPDPSAGPEVVIAEDNGPEYVLDDKGNTLEIHYPDGSIEIGLDAPLIRAGEDIPAGWFDNLATRIDENTVAQIAEDLLRGIRDDEQSRQQWLEDVAQGIKLMALKVELPQSGGSPGDGAGIAGISQYRDSLLKEAVLRFQANARSELLPTDGPVKVRNDDNNPTLPEDQLANALENDFNHYLTVTASEYYADTDRMLLTLGMSGVSFKKVYYCPLRQRPVSESVAAEDLIVNQAATDLRNAKRVTHRIQMSPNTVRRMQILGAYRDIDLGTPQDLQLDVVQQAKKDQEGIAAGVMNPDDRVHDILECYCELDIRGYEHQFKGKASGLEVPYRVTLDRSSRKILSIVRNYKEDKQDLPDALQTFVKYTFVPGLGFYGIGLVHVLGNDTNALTALKREMIDAGMFANFPGFLWADVGGRQKSNVFRVQPGGGAQINTGGAPIGDVVMPLPYKEPGPAMFSLIEGMSEDGQRLGGTSEQPVAEGKQEAPVGTTLAMIEQAQKVLNAVHKRLHASQAEEFRLLADVFRQHPESFWNRNPSPTAAWDADTFVEALSNYNLTPQADPNTASQLQRMMKAQAVYMMAKQDATGFDPIAVRRYVLNAIGAPANELMAPLSTQQQPPPEIQKQKAEIDLKAKDADTRRMQAQTDAQRAQSEARLDQGRLAIEAQRLQQEMSRPQGGGPQQPDPTELALRVHQQQLDEQSQMFQQHRAQVEDENRDKDREANLADSILDYMRETRGQRADHAHDFLMQHHQQAHQAHMQANQPRVQRAHGGAVTAEPDRVVLLMEKVAEALEAMSAPQEVVRDENNRIIGTRRKRRDEEVAVEIMPTEEPGET